MTEIRLYNTLHREKQVFTPQDPNRVTMYICGPTVYDYIHIGNARPAVIFDSLFRLLRHRFGVDHVFYARNFTDIDDKIMDRAAEQGVSTRSLTQKFLKAYQDDVAALQCLAPSHQPKATEHLPEMIAMIKTLLDKGYAYEAEGHVLFHVGAMETYGSLSGHSRDELIAGARVEVAPYKRDPADFVLWKPSDDRQPGWGSPFGRGRPGWHLECSCMAKKHLDETIDIHGGGQDLIFPHHENEIAQSECANGSPFARFWVHNGYLTSDGVKMSKSLGNFHTVRDLLGEHHGEVLRLSLLVAHYRQPIDFSRRVLADCKKRLDRWYRLVDGVETLGETPDTIIDALSDDINTPKALAAMDDLARRDDKRALKAAGQFLGIFGEDSAKWFKPTLTRAEVDAIHEAINRRAAAKADQDFATADAIRADLADQGIILEDKGGETLWRRR